LAFGTSIAMDENSICRIYSMTKNVTRIATLLLVEDGVLALDQPVASVLPEFRNLRVATNFEQGLASRPATRMMTMRHLITDSSGLGNWTPASDSGEVLHRLYRERGITPGNFGQGLTRPGYGPQPATLDELAVRAAGLPLAYEPGTVLHYSIGFDVMALVIERVTGVPYGGFLQKRLFGPLGMASTGFQVARADAPRLTSNYDATQGFTNTSPGAPPDGTAPANMRLIDDRATSVWLAPPALLSGGGGLVSTARDFLRYARMLLEEGTLGDVRVMRPETARLATGDIRPAGLAEPSEAAGAGTRALLRTPLIPPGTVGAGGAAGTLFWIDKAGRGAFVFMAQAMYGNPARSPFQRRLFAAIERDIAAHP
jgi:CubicO group peptidase (beta-lactamase class C family)